MNSSQMASCIACDPTAVVYLHLS